MLLRARLLSEEVVDFGADIGEGRAEPFGSLSVGIGNGRGFCACDEPVKIDVEGGGVFLENGNGGKGLAGFVAGELAGAGETQAVSEFLAAERHGFTGGA